MNEVKAYIKPYKLVDVTRAFNCVYRGPPREITNVKSLVIY